MPKSDVQRISKQSTNTRALTLWRTLNSLKCCASFMNTGAHPDDETSAMLAALAYRDGLTISYACANRGEGGQNNIGSQNTSDLGVIRTAEMEQAANLLGLRLYWLNESAEDSVFDFGFSKSGVETLSKWGHKRTLKRFVEIIRTERPDIICTTFLDIPGQHGHHRAMTQLAHEVFDAAADHNFSEVDLPIWQIKKMYLPAWSGAGDSYDDDLPPPPATLIVNGKGEEPISGWTYEQIGQQSRQFHRSQGMGRWVSLGQERDWPLHLARTRIDADDTSLTDGLPSSLESLANFANAEEIRTVLQEADNAIDAAINSFPNVVTTRQSASTALKSVRRALNECPEQARGEVEHRLQRTLTQLSTVIRLCSKAKVSAWFNTDLLRSGDKTTINYESDIGDVDTLDWDLTLPKGWERQEDMVQLTNSSVISSGYPTYYYPDEPTSPALKLSINVDGAISESSVPLETRPLTLPAQSARLSPTGVVHNINNGSAGFIITISDLHPQDAIGTLQLPKNWTAEKTDTGYHVSVPANTAVGDYNIKLLVNDQPASTVNHFDFPHIEHTMRSHRAQVKVCVLDVFVPSIRVGYVGGGNDTVSARLSELGFNLESLTDEQLIDPTTLDQLDTLVLGIFAVRTRAVLQDIMPRIHQWVENGGNLVTLYHRPWDDWNEHTTPPKRLLIGKPSLRWRVTDENASVNYLLPEHPLLTTPNVIGPDDWLGWHKERGLYFAAEWDSAYEALLCMADPDEEPLNGALVSAEIGKGRHTHTSLILHHQMELLVSGAYRLMANLVAGKAKQ